MTICEFVALTADQQQDYLVDVGQYLGWRLDEAHSISLYQVEEFFVEVFFDRKSLCVTQLSAFEAVCLPQAYLESQEPTPQQAEVKAYLSLRAHLHKRQKNRYRTGDTF